MSETIGVSEISPMNLMNCLSESGVLVSYEESEVKTEARKENQMNVPSISRRFNFSKLAASVVIFSLLLLSPGVLVVGDATAARFTEHDAEVSDVRLHYLRTGHGPAVILLHGYIQTSRMWRPIIPVLAEKFTVIAPDLPRIGDSDIPADGLDMKTAAVRVHALAKSLGVEKARVLGHDIGLERRIITKTRATTVSKLGSICYAFWGLLHFQASYLVYKVGESLPFSMAQARVYQDAWNLFFFALTAVVIALWLNWRNGVGE